MNDYLLYMFPQSTLIDGRDPSCLLARDVCFICKRPVVERDGAHCCMEHGVVIPIRSNVENGAHYER